MYVAKTCVEHGKKNGIFVAVGASVIVLVQALIAILLAKYIFGNPFIQNMLLRAGLVIFFIMAVFFFVKARRAKVKEVTVPQRAGIKSFGGGVMIATLNVLPIPYFCALGAALNINDTVEYHILTISSFVLAAAAGTFTALYGYIFFFDKIDKKSESFARYSNYFMAGLMLILVIVTLIRILYY